MTPTARARASCTVVSPRSRMTSPGSTATLAGVSRGESPRRVAVGDGCSAVATAELTTSTASRSPATCSAMSSLARLALRRHPLRPPDEPGGLDFHRIRALLPEALQAPVGKEPQLISARGE